MLLLFNKIKQEGKIPKFILKTTITTIPKKGTQTELKKEREIFLVNTVREIFMRPMFNSEYDMFNANMSDSNIGGKKGKSCNNHIWVINSIIQDQIKQKSHTPIIFQQYDFQQMFDSMSLMEACADIYDLGLKITNCKFCTKQTMMLHSV